MIEFGKWYYDERYGDCYYFFCVKNNQAIYLLQKCDGKSMFISASKARMEMDIKDKKIVFADKHDIARLDGNVAARIKKLIKECFNDDY